MGDTKAQRKTEQEIASLYQEHYRQLCVVALNYVQDVGQAQDIVQDFFINYWERRAQGIERPDNFRGYAMRAVRNISIDRLRKQSVEDRRMVQWNIGEDTLNNSEDPDQLDAYHKRLQRIFELIEQLPQGQRTILKLHALDKMSYAQIAERQNISINTVRTQLTRAYSSLRKSVTGLLLLSLLRYL